MRTLTVLLLVLVLVAGAEIVTFQPDAAVGKDSLTVASQPDENYGDRYEIRVMSFGSDFLASFIEFVELNDAEYENATVDSAELCLYVFNIISYSGHYDVGACSAVWDEMTITWNNKPAVHESFSEDYPTGYNIWITLDVTEYVQNWLDGTWENYGFSLFDEGGSSDGMYLFSSDNTSHLRPKLILDYSGAAVEETTWGEIKASL